MSNVQLLLLAAGGSRRMKEPKQLLPWGATTVIEHQIKNLLNTGKPLTVVLGAYVERIIPIIESYPITIIHNTHWKSGMSTSIGCGIRHIFEQNSSLDGVLISLIDQPLLTTIHFNKMLQSFQPNNKRIIVSKAEDTWAGAPVLFDKVFVEELSKLKGDDGAKIVANKYKKNTIYIDGGDQLKDMDIKETYHELLAIKKAPNKGAS